MPIVPSLHRSAAIRTAGRGGVYQGSTSASGAELSGWRRAGSSTLPFDFRPWPEPARTSGLFGRQPHERGSQHQEDRSSMSESDVSQRSPIPRRPTRVVGMLSIQRCGNDPGAPPTEIVAGSRPTEGLRPTQLNENAPSSALGYSGRFRSLRTGPERAALFEDQTSASSSMGRQDA